MNQARKWILLLKNKKQKQNKLKKGNMQKWEQEKKKSHNTQQRSLDLLSLLMVSIKSSLASMTSSAKLHSRRSVNFDISFIRSNKQ